MRSVAPRPLSARGRASGLADHQRVVFIEKPFTVEGLSGRLRELVDDVAWAVSRTTDSGH